MTAKVKKAKAGVEKTIVVRCVPKFIQVCTGQWSGEADDMAFSIIALGEDGRCYRFVHGKGGWVAYPDNLVGEY